MPFYTLGIDIPHNAIFYCNLTYDLEGQPPLTIHHLHGNIKGPVSLDNSIINRIPFYWALLLL